MDMKSLFENNNHGSVYIFRSYFRTGKNQKSLCIETDRRNIQKGWLSGGLTSINSPDKHAANPIGVLM